MQVGKLSVPGRPTNLDHSRARAHWACSKWGWGLFGRFSLVCHFSVSPSLWKTVRYILNYCLKGLLNPQNNHTFGISDSEVLKTELHDCHT